MKLLPLWRFLGPLYETPGSGSGGGGGAAGAGGTGGGTAGAGGAGAPQTYKLTDDSMVDFGDGKAMKWSEARSTRYVDRGAYDRGVKFLEGEAAKLEKSWEEYRKGTGPKPQPQQGAAKVDILDEIKDLSVIDGATASKLVRALREEGLGPLAQVVSQMHAKMVALEKQVGSAGAVTGHIAEQHQSAAFEQQLTNVLGGLGQIKGLPDGAQIDAADPFIREMAKDVYLSHDQNTWRQGEYEKMLKARIEGAVSLTRALDKKALETAKTKRRQFFDPSRGAGRPSGEAGYKHLNGSQMAEALFGQMDPSRT